MSNIIYLNEEAINNQSGELVCSIEKEILNNLLDQKAGRTTKPNAVKNKR